MLFHNSIDGVHSRKSSDHKAFGYIRLLCLFYMLFCYPGNTVFADEDDEDEGQEQDLLFLLEEAYSQEQGEWQFSLDMSRTRYEIEDQGEGKDYAATIGVEYGFTDRLQTEIEIPYQRSTFHIDDGKETFSSIGNPEIGLSYQLMQEESDDIALSIGFEVGIKASSEKEPIRSDSWSREFFLNSSKYIDDIGFVHASVAYEVSDHNEEKEFTYGLGFASPISDSWLWIIEAQRVKESEEEDGETENERVNIASFAIVYETEPGLLIALAYSDSNRQEVNDNQLSLKLQYEF